MIPDSAAIRAASRGSTTPALLSPSVRRISTLLASLRAAQAVDAHRDSVADRGREFFLERLRIDHPALALSRIGLGISRPLHDIDQGAVVEGQGALAIGEPAKRDEPDEIIRAAR